MTFTCHHLDGISVLCRYKYISFIRVLFSFYEDQINKFGLVMKSSNIMDYLASITFKESEMKNYDYSLVQILHIKHFFWR